MNKDTESVAIQGYEFWLTICEEEIARKSTNSERKLYNFCRNGCITFIDLLINHVVNGTDPNLDEDESSLGQYAFNLLSYFSQLCEYLFIEKILNYVNDNICSKEIRMREAAIIILTSTFEFQNKDQGYNFIHDYIKRILERVSENDTRMREKACWCLEKLCKEFAEYVIKSKKTFEIIVNTIIGLLENSNNKSTVFLLCSLHYLAVSLKPNEFQTSSISILI
jgi:hypothetical protein